MKTGTRVRSPKPPFYETALLSPSESGGLSVSRLFGVKIVWVREREIGEECRQVWA